jgi:HAMP domain-containing protein
LSELAPNSIELTPISEQLSPTNGIRQLSGFPRKLVGILISVLVLFGSMTCVIVFTFLEPAIKQQVQDRTGILALGLGEVVAAALPGENEALSLAVASYAVREKVAYAYVEDHEGRMIAHWPADLPRYLRRDFPDSSIRALTGTIVDYRGMSLYAAAKRIEQDGAAFVHVAVDQGIVHDVMREVVLSVAFTIAALGVICCISLFVWTTRAIQGPWLELINHASRISTGDFSGALPLEREDEFGDLARSLERLRSSLHAATARFSAR